jgi:hypothetical protein
MIYTVTNGRKTKIIDFKSKINSYAVDSKTRKIIDWWLYNQSLWF